MKDLEFKPWWLVTNEGAVVGHIKYYKSSNPKYTGWIFHPHNQRQPGRKHHDDMNSAIPQWAFDLSDDLLDSEEFSDWKKYGHACGCSPCRLDRASRHASIPT